MNVFEGTAVWVNEMEMRNCYDQGALDSLNADLFFST